MDFEATSGRAPPARPEHALRMAMLPLQERAAVLRQAARALQPYLQVGRLLPAEESPRCHCRIALGVRTCLGLKGRPYFAARGEMVRMLEGLAARCVTQWQCRLSRPLHAAPMADFSGGFFPPAPAGKAPLRLYPRAQRRPRCPLARPAEQSTSSGAAQPVAAQGVSSSRCGLGKGRGSTGGLCPTHRAPSCALPGNGPGGCQLLPVRTRRPPQGNGSTDGPGIVRHVTRHVEATAGGAGLRGQRHAWLAAVAE